MTKENPWENIYGRGEQLNYYPYTDVVSFCMRLWGRHGGAGKRGLDVGCGSGVHSGLLSDLGADVTAFDYSESAIEHAKRMFPNEKIKYMVSDFDGFNPGDDTFDMVIDRCSSTQSSKATIHNFYKRLKDNLNSGAQLFWQGFHWDNSGRELGTEQADGSFTDFTGGVFEGLGSTVFLKEEELHEVFEGYTFVALRETRNIYKENGYDHSGWALEMRYDK